MSRSAVRVRSSALVISLSKLITRSRGSYWTFGAGLVTPLSWTRTSLSLSSSRVGCRNLSGFRGPRSQAATKDLDVCLVRRLVVKCADTDQRYVETIVWSCSGALTLRVVMPNI